MKKIILLITSTLMIFTLCSCNKNHTPKVEQVKAICELSTIKAYFNNVAKSTKESGKNWWNFLEKDREFWIEYDGVAEIGIDMDKLKIESNGDIITVTMPKAELLNTRIVKETFDENSYITNNDSWWDKNKITTEDQQKAINEAQEKMTETVKANKSLFEKAERIAKNAIENYFNKINDITGSNFKVKWK